MEKETDELVEEVEKKKDESCSVKEDLQAPLLR